MHALCVLKYLSGGSVGPWAWLLELSPEVPVFWVPACCPSCPLWGPPPWPWLPMFPKGGKEVGLAEGIPLPGWPEDVTRLLDDAEPFADPLLLLPLLEAEELAAFTEPLSPLTRKKTNKTTKRWYVGPHELLSTRLA